MRTVTRCSATARRVDELRLDANAGRVDQLDDHRDSGRLEVRERAVPFCAVAARALQRRIAAGESLGDGRRMIVDELADVMEPFTVEIEVVGEDARPIERLDQFELDVALPGERVAERECDVLPEIAHLLETGRIEPVRRPGADAQLVGPAPYRPVEIADDQRNLLEVGA